MIGSSQFNLREEKRDYLPCYLPRYLNGSQELNGGTKGGEHHDSRGVLRSRSTEGARDFRIKVKDLGFGTGCL